MKQLFYLLTGLAVALLCFGLYQAFQVAPTESTMGPVQRIFYWHVPLFAVGGTAPYVNLGASIGYLLLRRKHQSWAERMDALAVATAEVTLLFVGLGLIAGILWGRPAWGVWWAWDARTTTTLLLWLLYVSYMLLRRYSAKDSSNQVIAAVLAVFAGVDVPIVYMSIRWWRTQHPAPVLTGEGQIDPVMQSTLNWNFLAFFLWGVVLVWARYAIVRREQAIAEAQALELLEA